MARNQDPNEPNDPHEPPDEPEPPQPPPLEPFQTSASVTVTVRPPFVPGPVERAFDATTYLDELLSLANRYARATGATTGPTKEQLAARLFQPLDRLTQAAFYEQATAPVAQARIAVEVLRGVLGATPLPGEQGFRGMAYDALLRELGTTYHELRQARLEQPPARISLANRLGIELGGTRPDRLDEIAVSPEEITNAQLAQLFGYRSTASSDPLQPSSGAPVMLVALQAGLKTVWRKQDEADRDVEGQELPVIDPDIIPWRNIRTGAAAARTLWSAREGLIADWHEDMLLAIGTTLAQLDAAIHEAVGAMDIAALAAGDAAGEDVTAALRPTGLSLQAFRHLVRLRAVFPGGALLASEKGEVASILVQARKVKQAALWRRQERDQGIILQPATFVPDPLGTIAMPPPWRGEQSTVDGWHATLRNRIQEADTRDAQYRAMVESAEALVLPQLRDALLTEIGRPQSHTADQVAERLSRELCLDLRAAGGLRTNRAGHAIGTVQSLLLSVRTGVFGQLPDPAKRLTIPAQEDNFDLEWEWLVSYPRWVSAMRAFAYPENQLQANLFRAGENSPPQGPPASQLLPTQEYQDLIRELGRHKRISPAKARELTAAFVTALRIRLGSTVVPAILKLTDSHTSSSLTAHEGLQQQLIPGTAAKEEQIPQTVRELFWLAPMAVARKLQDSREFGAALDWYQTVFNYQAEPVRRKIYRGLTKEMTIVPNHDRIPGWLAQVNLNPQFIARTRPGGYTRFTVVSIVECVLGFADSEFARDTHDANARARTLYQTAVDLLGLPEMVVPGQAPPFPANPVVGSLRSAAEAGLAKIHAGLNISGFAGPSAARGEESFLPSQYRYATLVERAKALVATAQQVESAYLSALERADVENYNLLQAGHDLRVAGAALDMQEIKVAGAELGFRLARLQRDKSQALATSLTRRLNAGLNPFERHQLDALRSQRQLMREASFFGAFGSLFSAVTSMASGEGFNPYGPIAEYKSGQAELAAQEARIMEVQAGYTRRQEEWAIERLQAIRDVEIGTQQIDLALNQRELALRERAVAQLNREHAEAVAEFLATKFTNAELHEWMSGVLGRVYAYFLQQATGMAQLAQAQLAFERQELSVGFIAADYWQDSSGELADPGDSTGGRRGLTGSARLMRDIDRLDQHAFQTDHRKLHVSQTFALSQLAAFELQQLRQTGVLTFATPEAVFDRDFPGHYLRLIKKITVDIVALVPPTRRIRATLSTAGISRAIVARGPFDTVTLRRDPEAIAFTSPVGATGVFPLQPDSGMLLPFEGMGVDAVWRLELPKAANPFDFNNIADVLFTVDYTALHSDDYRARVIRRLSRRFSGDRTLSLRNEFPDSWYALNNPDTVEEPEMRMRAVLPLTRDDFPPHIEDLAVRELSMFVVWRDADAGNELTVTSLAHDKDGTGPVTTVGGIASTRRPDGAAWKALTGPEHDPAGDWEIQLPDTAIVRSWFADGLIEDIVLVMSLSGTTPAWP